MLDRIRAWFRRDAATPPPAPAPQRGPVPGSVPAPSAGGWPDPSPGRTEVPPPPDRSSAAGTRASGLQVAADGAYDRHELERFVVSRLPQVDPVTVGDVLDIFDEHLAVRGIADLPAEDYRFYDPAERHHDVDPVVDGAAVAADAARFLGIEAATAERILDVEHDYLDAKGLIG